MEEGGDTLLTGPVIDQATRLSVLLQDLPGFSRRRAPVVFFAQTTTWPADAALARAACSEATL